MMLLHIKNPSPAPAPSPVPSPAPNSEPSNFIVTRQIGAYGWSFSSFCVRLKPSALTFRPKNKC